MASLRREHGGDVVAWASKAGVDPRKVVDLSASVNPLGPPASARKSFLQSLEEVSRYPDGESWALKTALAKRHRRDTEELLLGNGSTQLIYLLCRAICPCVALVVQPAFSEYGNALRLGGSEVRSHFLLPRHGFRLERPDFIRAIGRGVEMIFFANPNSATGQVIPRREMERIIRHCSEKKIFVVLDEAFMDFARERSVQDLIEEHPRLIVLRSLTKYYSLAGLRIGYLLAQREIVDLLGLHQEPWSVNGPVQKVALACLEDARFRLETSRWLGRERAFLFDALARMKGLAVFPSQANFVLARLERASGNAMDLRRFLLQRRILIRACDSFEALGAQYFRVAVHLRKNNELFLQGLRAYLRLLQPLRRSEESDGG